MDHRWIDDINGVTTKLIDVVEAFLTIKASELSAGLAISWLQSTTTTVRVLQTQYLDCCTKAR